MELAQDKRHDLAPHSLRLWVKKLEGFKDRTIVRALEQGRWEFFPSVDDVLKLIDEIQERDLAEAGNRDWLRYQESQMQAQAEGRMATEEDYAEMRAALRKIFGDPTAKQSGKASA